MWPRCGRFVDLLERDRPLMPAGTAQPQKINFSTVRERNRDQRIRFGAMGALRRTSEPHGDVCHRPVMSVLRDASEDGDRHAAVSSEFAPL